MQSSWMKRSKKSKSNYFNSYGQLYGDREPVQLEITGIKPKKIKSKPACPTEVHEQIVAATWLEKNNVTFYHIPNGGRRSLSEGVKFKRMGVKAGIPDLCIPLARKGYHGLYIELKRQRGGVISEAQQYWLSQLKKEGYDVYVAKGANDLISYVKNYMGV